MNPYIPSGASQDDSAKADATPAAGIEDHLFYEMVLKMVLWGERKEDVYHRLEVNGITGITADLLYGHARVDRVATIRQGYRNKLLAGMGLVVAGITTFCVCWYGLYFVPRILLTACFAAVGIGGWKAIDGISGYLMAESKEGSVAEEI